MKSYMSKFKNAITEAVQSIDKENVFDKFNEGKELIELKAGEINDKYITKTITDTNWNAKAYYAFIELGDTILNSHNDTTSKIVKSSAGKIGAIGTSAGLFSLATIAGTASTGTAIGTLSGAAFTNASLAWIGGSVLMGTIVVSTLSIAGGIGAAIGAKHLYKKYFTDDDRDIKELSERESKIYNVALYMATVFKTQSNSTLNSVTAKAIHNDVLNPLEVQLLEYKKEINADKVNKDRFDKVKNKIINLKTYIHNFTNKNPNFSIGVVSSVIMQLYAGYTGSFDENEEMVLEALKRSTNRLSDDATVVEISEYLQGYSPIELVGITNNIKGIYHEIRFVENENTDLDIYTAQMFEATNHAGADVIITNTLTGDTKEFQLKATDSLSYVDKHLERYSDIEVIATTEVAEASENIISSGLSNEEITNDVKETLSRIKEVEGTPQYDSIALAAIVSLAKNIKIILKGENMLSSDKKQIIEDIAIATGTAGLFTLLTTI